MKNTVKKYWAFLMVFVIVTGVCALFSYRKSGMFIDEIYSYGLSNSHYAPFVTSIKGGDMTDKVITQQEIWDYLSVGHDDKFDFGSVYYNQTQDVHPPLYYWLMNIASSVSGTGFSKWTGLALNYVIHILTLFFLCKLVYTLFGSLDNAAATAVLYGISVIGMSTMIMVRMYALLTLLTVILAYLVARLMKEKRFALYPLVGLTIFAGLMTQYYFIFYAFFLCAAYVIYTLCKKDWKSIGLFSLFAFLGVGALVLAFPASLEQLFSGKLVSGGSALENLLNVSQYSEKLGNYYDARFQLKATKWVFIGAVALALLLSGRIGKAIKAGKISADALVICLPTPVTFIFVAIASPVSAYRYIYNIIPILVLGVSFVLYLAEESAGNFKYSYAVKKLLVCLVAAAALWDAKWLPPDYLFPEHVELNAAIDAHASDPCVYIDKNYPAPITSDLLQLMRFEDFFVTDDPRSEKLLSYIGDADEIVVYIDRSKFWSSGFDSADILPALSAATGLEECQELFKYELSETYVLSRR